MPLGWAGETTLEVEWAHAIAPDATITLVVAANPGGDVLNNAVQYAVAHKLGDVLSMSYGVDEAAIKGNNGDNTQSTRRPRSPRGVGRRGAWPGWVG